MAPEQTGHVQYQFGKGKRFIDYEAFETASKGSILSGILERGKKGEKVLIGDEPLDLLHDAFQQIAETYESDVGRKPTLLELEVLIQMALDIPEGVLLDMDDYLIHECKLKKKRKPKKNRLETGRCLCRSA